MAYANPISSDEITTSAECCSRVQHAQCGIAELRLSSAADVAAGHCLMNANLRAAVAAADAFNVLNTSLRQLSVRRHSEGKPGWRRLARRRPVQRALKMKRAPRSSRGAQERGAVASLVLSNERLRLPPQQTWMPAVRTCSSVSRRSS